MDGRRLRPRPVRWQERRSLAAGNLCPRASPEPPFTTRLVMRDVIYGHPSCREAFLEPLAHPPPIEFASRFTA